jgi:hypothetical protein
VKVNLLDGVCDVDVGECLVLEGLGEALEVQTQRKPWSACPLALRPACSPPCQLAQEY